MENKSVFDPAVQAGDLQSKIVAGLERLSEVFRVLLWDHAKAIGLSPMQIQLLIFLVHHKEELSHVTHLAKEFNLSKPTISEAIRVLEKKELIKKVPSTSDRRAYSIFLSEKGLDVVNRVRSFANPIRKKISRLDPKHQEILFISLSELIYALNKAGILQVQRICFGCQFYEKRQQKHYCRFLKMDLAKENIRIDCPEFEAK